MSSPHPAIALLEAYRQQRPLRGGSLIVTVFGDSLLPRGGAITLGSLIRLLEPFGLAERLVRTSVGRLSLDGWLTFRREGRLSEYAPDLAGRRRFAEAAVRVYGGPEAAPGPHWTCVLLPAEPKARAQLREQLRWRGFGVPDPGLCIHPSVSAAETMAYLEAHDLGDAVLFQSTVVAGLTPADLVLRGWNLAELGARYRAFVERFSAVADACARTEPEPFIGFVVRTLLVHEYRRIHLRDPLLPAALLPAHWDGLAAYELCRSLYRAVTTAAEAHLSTVARRLDGTLAAADASLGERFPPLPASSADIIATPAENPCAVT